jgi:hypothetical protein
MVFICTHTQPCPGYLVPRNEESEWLSDPTQSVAHRRLLQVALFRPDLVVSCGAPLSNVDTVQWTAFRDAERLRYAHDAPKVSLFLPLWHSFT